MKLLKWDELPSNMQTEKVLYYYNILKKRQFSLKIKRVFDILASICLITLLIPVFLVISIMIKCDSKGSILFRQIRVTQYGRKFTIYKFRTMIQDADRQGTQVTIKGDKRITEIGKIIRKYRLDELPQLFNVFLGDMTFVGTRPEVPKYVKMYSDEMLATLLLPAGITSNASIEYKDEDELLNGISEVDEIYKAKILPEKMEFNLKELENFSISSEVLIMLRTVCAVLK